VDRFALALVDFFQDFGYSIAPLLHNETERMGASVFLDPAFQNTEDPVIDCTQL